MSTLAEISPEQKQELACSLAVLALHDGGVEVTGEAISKVLAAAKIEVAAYWPMLFARLCANREIDDMLLSGGGGAAAPVEAAGGAGGEAAAEEEEEEKEEEKSVDMGGGNLFGGDDDDDY